MKRLLLIAMLVTVTLSAEGPSYYANYCKEHPFAKKCISDSLGGKDSINKERHREKRDDYRYTNDTRQHPGQDLDDPRESL